MNTVWLFLIWATVFSLLDSPQLVDGVKCRVKYFLYTSSNPSEPEELVVGDSESVETSNFDSDNPTKIIIHGWHGSAAAAPNPELRTAYLDKGEYNIISVDWSGCAAMIYLMASNSVSIVGANVAKFIDFLNDNAGMSFDSLVVVGYSLGAHVAGFAGKNVNNGRLAYIVGLDPARPRFNYDNPDKRLNSNDADYVETIQTNGGFYVLQKPIGSASFYPNWGPWQPGCIEGFNGFCAHYRSVLYYAEAISGHKFSPVYRCESFIDIEKQAGCDTEESSLDIGDPTEISRENGIFFFSTPSRQPFGHT